MSDVSTALGTAGAGETFEALGRTWTVLPPSQEVKSAFEAWMKMARRQELLEQKPFLSADDFRDAERRLTALIIGRKEFAYGGPFWREIIPTEAGSTRLFWLCLRQAKGQGETTFEMAEALIEAEQDAAQWAFRMALAQADPSLFSPPMKPATTGTEKTPEASPTTEEKPTTIP